MSIANLYTPSCKTYQNVHINSIETCGTNSATDYEIYYKASDTNSNAGNLPNGQNLLTFINDYGNLSIGIISPADREISEEGIYSIHVMLALDVQGAHGNDDRAILTIMNSAVTISTNCAAYGGSSGDYDISCSITAFFPISSLITFVLGLVTTGGTVNVLFGKYYITRIL